MSVSVSLLGFALVIGLGLLHVYAGHLPISGTRFERHWASFGAGVSLAYVFVDVLPLLARHEMSLAPQGHGAGNGLIQSVYPIALAGLAAFYCLELIARRQRLTHSSNPQATSAEDGVFWVHMAAFALYNGVLGYLLRETEDHGLFACLLLFVALALHFVVTSTSLRQHHQLLYDRYGRWLLAFTVVCGYLLGTQYMVEPTTIALLWAIVVGGLILNVFKDELPEHRNASMPAFLSGLAGYTALLINLSH